MPIDNSTSSRPAGESEVAPVEQGEALRAVEAAKTIRQVIRRVLPSHDLV